MLRLSSLLVPGAALGLMLAACAPERGFPPISVSTPPGPAADPGPIGAGRTDLAACGGDKVARFIGLNVASLPATGGWGALRILRPGMMMTLDYSATRLNVNVDDTGIILDMSCG